MSDIVTAFESDFNWSSNNNSDVTEKKELDREQDRKLKDILDSLITPLDKDKHEDIIKKLRDVYGDQKYRHSYSIINNHLMKTIKNDISKLSQIAENIREIYLDQVEKNNDEVTDRIFKLYDHINLEAVQLQFMASTSKQITEARDQVEDTKEQICAQAKSIENIEANLAKGQTSYITILGIFASIIIAFVATLSFSTSVLQNIDKPNTFKLIAIICFLSIFIVNILNLLFNFIREIHFGKEKNKKDGIEEKEMGKREKNKDKKSFSGLLAFNIMIIIVALACLYCSLEYDKKYPPQKDSNSTINFNITSPRF
ncbi:hypothetical protein [Campylobacter concisus]|uniref:hypothetical protein n=1 Tax=Campylobacter concisus TaxID=199 RepID=UPI000D335EED|nr:hypothetical protein [Campylobacter concisus]